MKIEKQEDIKRNCPDCENPLKFVHEFDTERSGHLAYYYCKNCEETFVNKNGGDLAIAADKYTGK